MADVVLAWDVTPRLVITTAYLIFWGPLFAVTLVNWDWDYEDAKASTAHEVFWHKHMYVLMDNNHLPSDFSSSSPKLTFVILGHSPRGLRPCIRKPCPADGATQGNQTGDHRKSFKNSYSISNFHCPVLKIQ